MRIEPIGCPSLHRIELPWSFPYQREQGFPGSHFLALFLLLLSRAERWNKPSRSSRKRNILITWFLKNYRGIPGTQYVIDLTSRSRKVQLRVYFSTTPLRRPR